MSDDPLVRVLVVDDEPSVCRSLVGFLEDHDFDVMSASSAENALELSLAHSYAVAVVDIRLPGMDGDALIRQLHRHAPDTRFLIYTGSVNYYLSPELEGLGMQQKHVLRKPLADMSVLTERIHQLLQNKEKDHG
jgi:two-component system response regulator (stage 0 sporulation protein F)